ncbi:MAG TPA: hypothetical protein VD766_13020, partial [Solirubrobacterales bacterium]|nr:hypothetical protein [Solirubrobacterales bacterium]
GEPAPPPDEDKRRNGVEDNAAPFPTGANSATSIEQPKTTRRLDRASFLWQGGPDGTDRPLDRAFVTIQRKKGGRWRAVDSDLGLRILWKVDSKGAYEALWEAPQNAPRGRYRFKITANLYRIKSRPFRLRAARDLEVAVVDQSPGRAVIELHYPRAVEDVDLTWRPARAKIASAKAQGNAPVSLSQNGRTVVVTGAPGQSVEIPAGGLRDPSGNKNGDALSFELGSRP